jgi:3-deoxy-D-manno-octulosonate 8-phosphate phosphatase (KDO 8-P phosphatase)
MSGPSVRRGADEKAARVRLFLMDVDGVLTDGGIILDGEGRETKRFHVRDGHGIKMLQRAGVETGIITGRTSQVVEVRARELGVRIVRQGAHEKGRVLKEVLAELGVAPEESAYVGDDIVDLPVFREVGFSAAPRDAEPYVLDAVDFVSSRPGGMGAVREIIDYVLKAKDLWRTATSKYFEKVPRI